MPNLVGTGLNQVPTNSMLGGLAYQDPEHASIKDLDLKNLSQINSEISDTAVDVFVYDTRKDSDGGAWRKRTQHTSWYNETLGTATRGTRREFPAVAVIVAESAKVTIYDGDDPDLPMWMVINHSGAGINATTAVNGVLYWGCSSSSSDRTIYFVKDKYYRWWTTSQYTGYFNEPVSGRNGTLTGGNGDTQVLVNGVTNDVAMTVLPNAPIDDATGLPIPTIAVATNSGVSVIKDDGTVYDVIDGNSARICYDVSFTKDHKLMHTGDLGGGSTYAGNVFVTNILTADRSEYDNNSDLYRWYSTSVNYPRINGGDTFATRVLDPVDVGGHHYAMADVGVSLIEDGTSSSVSNTDGMVAYITSDYNSGYMQGDIKGAFLSDTTAESLTANTNLASNFVQVATSRLTSETYDNGDTSWQMVDDTGSANGYVMIGMPGLTIGQSYIVSITLDNNAVTDNVAYQHKVVHLNGLPGENSTDFLHWNKTNASSETLTGVFTAQSVNDDDFLLYANAITLNVSNFIVREVDDEDRSVNNKGLQVFGTVTKSAVATGAELVGYSGFSNSNVLVQPYNSDLDPGTGDYSFMCWFKCSSTGAEQIIMRRFGNPTVTGGMMLRVVSSTSVLQWYVRGTDTVGYVVNTSQAVDDNVWHCAVGTREGGTAKLYLDGQLIDSQSVSTISHDPGSTAKLCIGAEEVTNSPGTFQNPASNTTISLVRYSLSIPTSVQVKKMYEDEKVLFQENAKATLYGSSDAVTALAYDDSTNLLHVGTSAGRSEFQGLRRINNTTTAVTTAISASNGLIAEQ